MTSESPKRQRTCIGCGRQSDKVELFRVVKASDGVRFDASGRMPGRGAYVCSAECFKRACKGKKLQRSLKCNIGDAELELIGSDLEGALPKEGDK